MIKIKLPRRIKVGGFTYKIRMSERENQELNGERVWGRCRNVMREIIIASDIPEEQLSQTTIHEFIHAIDEVYNQSGLDEKQVSAISNGLFQMMEQLGVRLIK